VDVATSKPNITVFSREGSSKWKFENHFPAFFALPLLAINFCVECIYLIFNFCAKMIDIILAFLR
ncbi:hypothetical protein BpHYR1_048780, partial [Brachionus plicatilis]